MSKKYRLAFAGSATHGSIDPAAFRFCLLALIERILPRPPAAEYGIKHGAASDAHCLMGAIFEWACHKSAVGMEFDWDDNKAKANLVKHGVTFLEAASVFEDSLSVTFPDPDHSDEEERLVILGHSSRQRLLFVAHTDQDERTRLISARPATRREREVYEETV